MRPRTFGSLGAGYLGKDETGINVAPVDTGLLLPGIGLLAFAMYFLGGRHEPQRRFKERKSRRAQARTLREKAKKLEGRRILGIF